MSFPTSAVIFTVAASLVFCVHLTVLEIKRGKLLGEGRGGRTLGWFLLPVIFMPAAYVISASGSGTDLSAFAGGAATQLYTQALSVSSILWIAWIPVLVYSALARDPAKSKAGWVLRRLGTALVLFLVFVIIAVTAWYALGSAGPGGTPPAWASAALNALYLVGVSSAIAFLSPFASLIGGTFLSFPVLVASFAVPAVMGRSLVRANAVFQAAPPRLASDHARLWVTVRLHGSKGHRDVDMIVDTGATDTNISPSLARDLGISSGLGSAKVILADGSVRRSGRGKAIIEYGPSKARVTVSITPVAEPLLGKSTLEALGLRVDPVAKRLEPSRPRQTSPPPKPSA